MLIVGLTGDIACGKSTVARMLAAHGAAVIDADLLVRELYADAAFARRVAALFAGAEDANAAANEATKTAPSASAAQPDAAQPDIEARAQAQCASSAGSALLLPDGSINRAALGELVFSNSEALRHLEALVHPAVAELREQKIRELQRASSLPPAVVLEAVKLIESGAAQRCNAVWWITSDAATQWKRLQERGLDEAAARRRLANQPSHQDRRARLGATPLVIIENNGTLGELQQRVEEEWQRAIKS